MSYASDYKIMSLLQGIVLDSYGVYFPTFNSMKHSRLTPTLHASVQQSLLGSPSSCFALSSALCGFIVLM
jgi:hypothetical protein